MAKNRKTGSSAYTKNRNNIIRYFKKHYGVNLSKQIPTQKELAKAGIKGKELTRAGRGLKLELEQHKKAEQARRISRKYGQLDIPEIPSDFMNIPEYTDTETDLPEMDIISEILDKISEIPDTAFGYTADGRKNWWSKVGGKNELISILEERMSLEDTESIRADLFEHQSEIITGVETMIQASNEDDFNSSFALVAQALKGSALTLEEMQELSDLAELA